MYVQKEILRNNVSMAFGETFEFDLPKDGLLVSLVLYVAGQQTLDPFLAAIRKWRIVDYLTKIELMGDGSIPIKSLDGVEAITAAFYDDFREPVSMWRNYAQSWQRQWIPIHFGRGFGDEEYFLNLNRFDQVTLKVTNDASATEFQTDLKVTIVAYWLREFTGTARGYFREDVWKSWTPIAGQPEYCDLPVGLPIRRILLEARPAVETADCKNESSMRALMSDIDYTYRSGQLRVFKGSIELLGNLSVMEMPCLAETYAAIDRNAELGYEVGVGYVHHGVKAAASYTLAPSEYPYAVCAPDVQHSSQIIRQRMGDAVVEGAFKGFGYGHCVPLHYALKPGLDDILDPETEKVVKVDILCEAGTDVAGSDRNARSAVILSRLVR